jgi:hypothetical protein
MSQSFQIKEAIIDFEMRQASDGQPASQSFQIKEAIIDSNRNIFSKFLGNSLSPFKSRKPL